MVHSVTSFIRDFSLSSTVFKSNIFIPEQNLLLTGQCHVYLFIIESLLCFRVVDMIFLTTEHWTTFPISTRRFRHSLALANFSFQLYYFWSWNKKQFKNRKNQERQRIWFEFQVLHLVILLCFMFHFHSKLGWFHNKVKIFILVVLKVRNFKAWQFYNQSSSKHMKNFLNNFDQYIIQRKDWFQNVQLLKCENMVLPRNINKHRIKYP